jgi:hypothetical protein
LPSGAFKSIATLRLLRLKVIARACAGHAPRLVAAVGIFDLDDVGAEVGEDQRGRGPRNDVAEFEDAQAAQRKPVKFSASRHA